MAKPRGAAAPAPEQIPSSPRHRHRYKVNRDAKTERNAQRSENKARTALVLGGGAPNMALMAGAVAAFVQRGVTFDVVSASGAGSLAGLLWLAPKGQTPADALRSVVTMSISDAIYRHLPVNYKVFQKPGTWADLWRDALAANPFFKVKPHDYEHSAPYALIAYQRFRQDPAHQAVFLSQRLQRHQAADRRFYQARDHAGPFPGSACLPVHLRALQVE